MAVNLTESKLTLFLKKYGNAVTSLILSLYCLPLSFRSTDGVIIEASWKKALNYCVENGFIFGTDFVFTYGPLGFLSTRNTQFVGNIIFVVFDLFLFSGFYYFIRNYVSNRKGWFFITLAALILLRTSNYSQVLFLVFILFTALNFINNLKNYFELIYCSFSGILLFFIKVNYGFISIIILVGIAIILLFKNRKACLIYSAASLVFFGAIFFNVHLSLPGYLKYGYLLIKGYDESMYLVIKADQFPFLLALLLITLFFGVMSASVLQLRKTGNLRPMKLTALLVFFMALFLFYKNGFTRSDYSHWLDFFAVFPFFIIGLIMLGGFALPLIYRLVAILCILISAYGSLYQSNEKNLLSISANDISAFLNRLSLTGYFSGAFNEYDEDINPKAIFPPYVYDLIGRSSVDIFPYDIRLLLANKLNYLPRPVPQSYSVYSETLDSLNADHFYKISRPEFLIFLNFGIDYRYGFWDESLTKATIHLNYNYTDFLDGANVDSISPTSFLIFISKPNSHLYPKFTEISRQSVKMGDLVKINFPDSEAIYMKAEIQYTNLGNIERLMAQPPALNTVLYLSDGTERHHKAVRPVLEGPVLINKVIVNSIDLNNFLVGKLNKNKNIVAFSLNPAGPGFEENVKLTFLKFTNY